MIQPLGRRVLVAADPALHDGPTVLTLLSLLQMAGMEALVFDELPPHCTTWHVDTMTSMARASRTQMIVGLGGMRIQSVARLAAALAPSRLNIADLIRGKSLDAAPLPFVEVLSSVRHHSLFSRTVLLANGDTRQPAVLELPPGMVYAAVLDPSLTVSIPARTSALAAMDALLAAVESCTAPQPGFLSDAVALDAVALLSRSVVDLVRRPGELEPRIMAMRAAALSALSVASAGTGIAMSLVYALHARAAVPKSWLAASLLPHVLDSMATAMPEPTRAVALALGEDAETLPPQEAADLAARSVRRMIAATEVPARLREYGVTPDMIEEAAQVASGMPAYANSQLGVDGGELLQRAL